MIHENVSPNTLDTTMTQCIQSKAHKNVYVGTYDYYGVRCPCISIWVMAKDGKYTCPWAILRIMSKDGSTHEVHAKSDKFWRRFRKHDLTMQHIEIIERSIGTRFVSASVMYRFDSGMCGLRPIYSRFRGYGSPNKGPIEVTTRSVPSDKAIPVSGYTLDGEMW